MASSTSLITGTPGRGGAGRRRVRFGVRMRDAGADHHGVELVPWPVAPVGERRAAGRVIAQRAIVVMQEASQAPAADNARARRHAGQAETEDPDLFA